MGEKFPNLFALDNGSRAAVVTASSRHSLIFFSSFLSLSVSETGLASFFPHNGDTGWFSLFFNYLFFLIHEESSKRNVGCPSGSSVSLQLIILPENDEKN